MNGEKKKLNEYLQTQKKNTQCDTPPTEALAVIERRKIADMLALHFFKVGAPAELSFAGGSDYMRIGIRHLVIAAEASCGREIESNLSRG